MLCVCVRKVNQSMLCFYIQVCTEHMFPKLNSKYDQNVLYFKSKSKCRMFRNVVCLYNTKSEPKYAQNVVCFQSKLKYVQNVMQVNPSMFRMLCK